MSGWPVPVPALPGGVHPVLADVTRAAAAFGDPARSHTQVELAEQVADGADGTPTMRIDRLVEAAVVEAAGLHRVNLLSEEIGSLDAGSSVTLVVDPLDGAVTGRLSRRRCPRGHAATPGSHRSGRRRR